jgi:hypothetical protein
MTEAMGGDGFFNTCFEDKVFDDIKNHDPTEPFTTVIQKQYILAVFSRGLMHSNGILI